MPWFLLFLAGLLEIVWAIALKSSEGFTRLWPTLLTVVAMLASFGLLGIALRTLPISIAYAVWVGIGAVGTALFGIVFLAEPATIGRLLSVVLIVAGIVGLKLSS